MEQFSPDEFPSPLMSSPLPWSEILQSNFSSGDIMLGDTRDVDISDAWTVGSQYKMEMFVDVSNYPVTPSKEVMQALE